MTLNWGSGRAPGSIGSADGTAYDPRQPHAIACAGALTCRLEVNSSQRTMWIPAGTRGGEPAAAGVQCGLGCGRHASGAAANPHAHRCASGAFTSAHTRGQRYIGALNGTRGRWEYRRHPHLAAAGWVLRGGGESQGASEERGSERAEERASWEYGKIAGVTLGRCPRDGCVHCAHRCVPARVCGAGRAHICGAGHPPSHLHALLSYPPHLAVEGLPVGSVQLQEGRQPRRVGRHLQQVGRAGL